MYKNKILSLSNNKLSYCEDEEGRMFNKKDIVKSWQKAYFEKVSRNKEELGLRVPQFGALSAIRAHWSVASSPATIVLPTGTGKSETIFATIISERIKSSLIIVPSNLLREQMFEGSSHFGILPQLKMISKEVIYPTTFLYKSKIDENRLLDIISNSNIIISTPSMIKKLSLKALEKLISEVEVVIFDEAHHLGAPDWTTVRDLFSEKKILQFTATPFRNDGKKIDGKIIFNYGLSLAQKAGYFMPIDFIPIQEFDEQKSDEKIAETAIKQLIIDDENNLDHILLARANSRKRADELYDKIYSKYIEYNPVVIHTGIKQSKREEYLQLVRDGKSKIVICVDMFGEGIDIPSLKIAAIHDKYKSLPITLQFIGRFARSSGKKLGKAKLITNVAIEDLKENIEELYLQNSDWNQILNIHSSKAIKKEVENEEFIKNFNRGHVKHIDISQLKMKITTRMFKKKSNKKYLNEWKKVLNPERTTFLKNDEDFVYIFIEEVDQKVVWSNQKDILEYEYNFYVLFFDIDNGIIHLNDTDERKGNKLVEHIFPDSIPIKGESIYRCLNEINRLMISTLGLKKKPSGKISFRMFAGSDIKSGINEAVASGSIKSNLFGYGYQDGKRISIGCSYKGKIWMHWVERINFWTKWCMDIGKKVTNDEINTDDIIKNSLITEVIDKFPKGEPYKIILPNIFELASSSSKNLYISREQKEIPFFQAQIKCPILVGGNLRFEFWVNERKFIFEQTINKDTYSYKQIEGEDISVKLGSNTIKMIEYFKEFPPEITFIQCDGTIIVVEGNLKVVIKPKSNVKFPDESLLVFDWNKYGVDIKSESQGIERKKDSIQYSTIHNIVDQSSDIIFDDDGSGEIADIISIKINNEKTKVLFHFYHCKYSSQKFPGARVQDLYEVCGQAEKSIIWNDNIIYLIQRMIKREKTKNKNHNATRFEKGDIETLETLMRMVKFGIEIEMKITIVQPGVSKKKLTNSMKQLLLASDTYLKETHDLSLTCYFSE